MREKIVLYLFTVFLFPAVVFGQSRFRVETAPFSSSKYDEFSPTWYSNQIIYCSNEPHELLATYYDANNKSLYNIFSVEYTRDTMVHFSKSGVLSSNLITPFNDGPVSVNASGLMVFSRNLDVSKKSKDMRNPNNFLGLFFAEHVNGDWKYKDDFEHNSNAYSITTPCFSPDGRYLYFASDMPGGYGEADIFRSELKDDGSWGDPENLGPVVNSAGSEVCPFIAENGDLYYSSDGFEGMGAKDVYMTRIIKGEWIAPIMLDEPINSRFDDFGLITNGDFTEGYFSSNRKRTDDIYTFETRFPMLIDCDSMLENNYCFEFWDEEYSSIDSLPVTYEWSFSDGTKIRGLRVEHCLPGAGKYWAKLNIIDNSTSNTFFTQASMEFQLVDYEQPFIKSKKAARVNDPISFDGLETNLPEFRIESYTWDFGDGTYDTVAVSEHKFNRVGIYNVKLGITGRMPGGSKRETRCVEKQISVVRDNQSLAMVMAGALSMDSYLNMEVDSSDGGPVDSFFLDDFDPEEDVFRVEVLASERKVAIDDTIFEPLRDSYEIKEFYRSADSLYSYTVGEADNLASTYNIYTDVVEKGFTNASVRTYVLAELPTEVIAKINRDFAELADANFEFDKTSVAPGSYSLLDEVVRIMTENPDLVMEIAAHTDNIGSFEYNAGLSQKRAESIVSYLIGKGIAAERLIGNGYGESRPIDTNSTEEGRMNNRRVEFIILNKEN